MQFETAAQILTSIGQMQWATQSVQANRAKINRLFNGDPPWTESERLANRLNTNFNWLEGTRIATNARYQLHNAFFQPGNFFDIALDSSPKIPFWKREKYSVCMTQYVNRAIRKCWRFRSCLEQAHAQIVLHGPGPSLWRNRHGPVPNSIGVDDVVVPAGTYADLSNLDSLAIYREWTWSELYAMTHDVVDKGWNTEYVDALLKSLYKQPLQPQFQGNRWLFPEKISEDSKEQAAWASASLPKVLCWDFYYRNEQNDKWNRRILLDYNNLTPDTLRTELQREKPDFLYIRDNHADDVSQIIHFFIGNCSNVAPFRYYTIRSVGYLLYGVCYVQNMMRCRLTDHLLQSLLTLFRNVSEDDREKLENFELHHLGILPEGISVVPAGERYAANYQLVEMGLAQNRQLMAESSSSFLPDIATEGDKPAMTATESLIRNNASVTLTSSVLNQSYNQSESLYREICRRFSLGDKRDPLVAQVIEDMEEDDIPLSVLKELEHADVTPNRTMGGGNKAVQLTTSRALFEARGAFGPSADVPIKRKYILALTDDARFAEECVPDVPVTSSSSLLAQQMFATLMEGLPVSLPGSIHEPDYIETLLQMMAASMQQVAALQQQPAALPIAAQKIAGLVNVSQHVEQHVQLLAQDQTERERVRDYERAIQQLMAELRGYGEQISEMEQAQAKQQGGLPPEAQAKIISAQILAQNKAELTAATTHQKMQHKDAAFLQEQERKDAATVAEIRRQQALTHAEVAAKDLTTRADLIHQARQAAVEQTVTASDATLEQEHAQAKHEVDLQAAKSKETVAKKTPKAKSA